MRHLFAVLLLLVGSSTLWAAPEIAFETLNHDFGEILQGDKVEYVYRFRNAGDEVLQVGNVRSSCGCTAALLSANRIAPGDFGELQVTFDSARFRGDIHKTVTIDTNDPRYAHLAFAISGNIKVELVVDPERINWGKVKEGTPLAATVKITNRGAQRVVLKPPKTTNQAVTAKVSQLELAPGEETLVEISAVMLENKNRLSAYVILYTDFAKVPQLRISVSARLAK